MIYKQDWFNSQGNGERIFQSWLVSMLRGQHWHVQEFEDRRAVGIPDVSAAGSGSDAWLELKVSKHLQSVHDYMRLDHGVTAQQHRWLLERSQKSKAKCGVLVSWRTGTESPDKKLITVAEYVTYIEIGQWRDWLNRKKLMAWGLAPFTAQLEWLVAGKCDLGMVLRGELVPGWGGSRVVQAARAPVVLPEQLG